MGGAVQESELTAEQINGALAAEGIDLADEQEEEDFNSVFNDSDSDDKPEPISDPEPVDEPETEDESESSSEDDSTSNDESQNQEDNSDSSTEGKQEEQPNAPTVKTEMSPELAAMTSRLRKTENKLGSIMANYNNISSQLAQLLEQNKKIAEPKNEKLNNFAEESEWGQGVKEEFNKQVQEINSLREQLNTQPKNSVSEEDHKQAIEQARTEEYFNAKYPGWNDEVRTTEFSSWLNAQDENIRLYAESSDRQESEYLLSTYYAHKQQVEQAAAAEQARIEKENEQKKRLQSAVSPTKAQAAPARAVNTEEDDFIAAFNE